MAAFSRRPVSSHLREGGLLRLAKDECWKCNFLGEEWFQGGKTQWASTPCCSGGKAPPHFHGLERKTFLPPPSHAQSQCLAKAIGLPHHPKWGVADRQILCQGCFSSQTLLPPPWLVLMLLGSLSLPLINTLLPNGALLLAVMRYGCHEV